MSPQSGSAEVLAEAVHTVSGKVVPYVLRHRNRFYVADVPFSYVHEADRYLVFCDLLFDILQVEPARRERPPAVLRIEDVSSGTEPAWVRQIAVTARNEGVPFHVALIPVFVHPLREGGRSGSQAPGLPVHEDPAFLSLITELREMGGTVIWHGVTHQYDGRPNPFSGISGEDYEFWDAVRDAPVAEDSVEYVLGLLDQGWEALQGSGLAPKVWEVPHYQASVLDYLVFVRVFSWTIGRVVYAPFRLPIDGARDPELWYERSGMAGAERRREALRGLRPEEYGPYVSQFFPYEILADAYGQRVLPENLGYPHEGGRTFDDILADARRNRILRDAWASFFVHPSYVRGRQDRLEQLAGLIRSLKEMGYEFVNLDRDLEMAEKGP